MINVFQLRSVSTSQSSDVFFLFSSISEDEVLDSNRFYNRFGQGFDLQNLTWSAELLKHSCEQVLLDHISEKFTNVPEAEKEYPLFFYYAILKSTSSTEDVIRDM